GGRGGGGGGGGGPSAQDLEGDPAGGNKVEGPRPVLSAGRRDLEPVILQPPVDLVHPLLGLLNEADVKGGGVLDFALPTDLHAGEGEHHPVVVRQEGNVVIASQVLQPEVLFET